MSKEQISPRGHTWDDVRGNLMSIKEREDSRVRVALMEELARSRNELGMSQQKQKELIGVAFFKASVVSSYLGISVKTLQNIASKTGEGSPWRPCKLSLWHRRQIQILEAILAEAITEEVGQALWDTHKRKMISAEQPAAPSLKAPTPRSRRRKERASSKQ